ncbi:uncharacterized protein [Triticum aestivum]|uniref:uncharacterized protein n=1 Tax=Triticum aestivum TaxID=4565 RepID=UPI001D01036C|nr:uncharacterized protein LOC123091717 [Triticum aestivum]
MLSEKQSVEPFEAMEAARPSASMSKESEPAGARGITATTPWGAHETNILLVRLAPHKALDYVIMHVGSRSYAFVLFRSITESRSFLEALCASKVKCTFIWIKFVRPSY